MLKTPHQFIFSCKANYPFKPHTLARLGKCKGALVWTTTGGDLLVASWLDKKAINTLTNAFERWLEEWATCTKLHQDLP